MTTAITALLIAGCAPNGSDAVSTETMTTEVTLPDATVPMRAVAMYPIDGSLAANAQTTISFRGVAPDEVDDLKVTGSVSGRHDGDLVAHRDGGGTTFRPDQPFEPGEQVRIETGVEVIGDDEIGFQVAVPIEPLDDPPGARSPELPDPVVLELATMPDAAIPRASVEGDVGTGVFLSTPQPLGDAEMGAQIIDAAGDLVWWRPTSDDGLTIGNLAMHELDGEPVLAWFEGIALFGPGKYVGEWIVVDSSYEEVARIVGANGIPADIHDLLLTDRGTAVVVAYQPVMMSLVDDGGPDQAVVFDSVVQEIDIESGDVHFEWHSLDAVPITETREAELTDDALDYAHINSVDLGPDGNVLVSLRHTSQVMEIDRLTGDPVWILGGDSNTVDVRDDPGISYPHHARWLGDGMLSVFDNGVERDGATSRGIVYQLSDDRAVAEVVDVYEADPPLYTATQGSIQVQNDGALAMWSTQGVATRFDENAQPTGTFDLGTGSYRLFAADWVGRPAASPNVVSEDGRITVSWNGATGVARWEASIDGEIVASDESDGFETVIELPTDVFGDATIIAVDESGAEIPGSEVTVPEP